MVILFFVISLVPALALYFWMRSLKKEDEAYRKLCRSALFAGFTDAVPIVLASAFFALTELLLRFALDAPVFMTLYHTFITLALAEEGVKCLTLFRFMKNKAYDCSWMDVVCIMTIIGLGFGLVEDIPYAIGAGPGVMLVRGVLIMHGGYGFIMGWFMGKYKKTGKKACAAAGFLLPWLLHGAYDCFLAEIWKEINEDFGIISVLLAGAALITVIVCIAFIFRNRNNSLYTEPLPEAQAESAG